MDVIVTDPVLSLSLFVNLYYSSSVFTLLRNTNQN